MQKGEKCTNWLQTDTKRAVRGFHMMQCRDCVTTVYPADAAPIIWLSSRDEVQICRGGADAVFENFTGVAVLSVTLYQTCHILYH